MFIELFDLFWFSLLSIALIYWWRAQQAKEHALQAAKKSCKEMDLQLLDHSIGLRLMRLKRDHHGRLRLFRHYHFEFSSTGDDRYNGSVTTLGHHIVCVEIEPHRLG